MRSSLPISSAKRSGRLRASRFPSQPSGLAVTEDTAPAPAGESMARASGFRLIDYILPPDTAWTAILFAVTALLVIALSFANRVGTVWLNTLMLQRLQLRLSRPA